MIQLEWKFSNKFCDEIHTVDYITIIKNFSNSNIGYYRAYKENEKWYLSDEELGNINSKEFDSLENLKSFAQKHYELKIIYNINHLKFGWPSAEDVDINSFDEDLPVEILPLFDIADSEDIYIIKDDKKNYVVKYYPDNIVGQASSYEEATKLAEKFHKETLINYFGITEKEYIGENMDFDFTYAGYVISKIRYYWNRGKNSIITLKDGSEFSYHFPKDGVANVKISNGYIGLSFTIKRQHPNLNIDHLLNTSFRFALDVCWLGKNIANKGIVTSISKRQERPTIKTLKENGFKIDNKTYQTLDLGNIKDVEKLFLYYKEDW